MCRLVFQSLDFSLRAEIVSVEKLYIGNVTQIKEGVKSNQILLKESMCKIVNKKAKCYVILSESPTKQTFLRKKEKKKKDGKIKNNMKKLKNSNIWRD